MSINSSRVQAILREDLMVQRIQYHIPFSPVPDLNCTARVGKVRQHHRPLPDLHHLLTARDVTNSLCACRCRPPLRSW
jgi:hypothetical protein